MMNDTRDHINGNKNEKERFYFSMMTEQLCTCSSYVRIYVLESPNGIHDVTHTYT